jgi:hypothetical protein
MRRGVSVCTYMRSSVRGYPKGPMQARSILESGNSPEFRSEHGEVQRGTESPYTMGISDQNKSGFKAVETKKYNANQHNAKYRTLLPVLVAAQNLALSPAPISSPNPLE